MNRTKTLFLFAFLLLAGAPALASDASSGGIAWYGTWTGGLAEAKRSGRPILLIAATPHCRNVSGKW